ncbi:MAG: EAL domain-containing protein [Spirochaetaceae bacterium]|nr:MAG: EAL domain-containing protein [Spirochaetaceae bacterium]
MVPGFFSSIIIPTLFLGALTVSALVFLLLSSRTPTPVYRALLLTSTVALLGIGAQIAGLTTLGFSGNLPRVAQWYRLEQVVVSMYLLAIPLLLESIIELPRRARRFNHLLLGVLFAFCCIIVLTAFIQPDLFISVSTTGLTDLSGEVVELTPSLRRTDAGVIRQVRDVVLALLAVYAVVSLLVNLRRDNLKTVLPVASGLVVAMTAGIDDLWMIYFDTSFLAPAFPHVQRLPIGMTVFTLLAVGAGFSHYLRDGRALARMRDRLSNLAYFDRLTGLKNRHSFVERLEGVCSRPAEELQETSVAVLVLDLDRFKDINDTLGHVTGDTMLIEVRDRLATRIRTRDELYRIGGDEFAIVVPKVTSEAQAGAIAEKLVNALQIPFVHGDRMLYTGVTIGIALHPRDGVTSDTLMRHAGVALARAKGERNTYRFYLEEMQKESLAKVRMISELRNAIANRELTVVYQPQCDTHGNAFGAEALLRWHSEVLGHVAPSQFIPVAEEHGLIHSIGLWVLKQVCQDHQTIMAEFGTIVPVSVNVSTRQLRDPDFSSSVISTLLTYEIPPESIRLEITESALMEQSALIHTTMNRLISAGVEFEIDDFGVGYSSLSYLRSLPVNTVKLDRSFIRNIPSNKQDSALVRALIALINGLNLDMVAEGVEDEEQKAFLADAGCTRLQGYLFSRPVPLYEFMRYLSEHEYEVADARTDTQWT